MWNSVGRNCLWILGLEYAGETKSGIDTGFEVIRDPHFKHLKYFPFFIVIYM